jgi:hypothetical protein
MGQRFLVLALRLLGIIDLLAFAAVVMAGSSRAILGPALDGCRKDQLSVISPAPHPLHMPCMGQ